MVFLMSFQDIFKQVCMWFVRDGGYTLHLFYIEDGVEKSFDVDMKQFDLDSDYSDFYNVLMDIAVDVEEVYRERLDYFGNDVKMKKIYETISCMEE